ncbi:hypothetical protein DFJ58DRAFT_220366 [Suillus subalutaceus]|uniref:uncharacterized protein n=1 Tax=Suillus subalutaceus TaxID=48586 RepID=UPI001B8764B7|nr:uncharacterized protein DFJ58DRAFT_220366 [Suillus subalutaceus]KAG1863210.1 hypothetical protein DFJ58DRAFT_220366 [Suillus subalutaceus]
MGVAALIAVVSSTRGLDRGVLDCIGTFLTCTSTIAASGYPPLQRNPAVLKQSLAVTFWVHAHVTGAREGQRGRPTQEGGIEIRRLPD